jgi:hypothetical protein
VTKRSSVASDWPAFDTPLLQDVAAAFTRRRKAIAYQAGLSCTRELSESASGTVERLNLDLCAGSVRLSVWADGLMWLGVSVRRCGRHAGWLFQDGFHGDVQDVSAETLVSMVEATLSVRFGGDRASERQQLREIWSRVRPQVN